MRIYTKTGDTGETALFGGQRASKSSKIFDVLGSLDELNSTLGFIHASKQKAVKVDVQRIQSDLFEIGSYLAGKKFTADLKLLWEKRVQTLEQLIDSYDRKNTPLQNFILPGGTLVSSYFHQSRAICRRVERLLVHYLKSTKSSKLSVFTIYLNRLSDLLFVMARYANKSAKVKDIIWRSATKV